MSWHEIDEGTRWDAKCKNCAWKTDLYGKYKHLMEHVYDHVEDEYSHEVEIFTHMLVGRNL